MAKQRGAKQTRTRELFSLKRVAEASGLNLSLLKRSVKGRRVKEPKVKYDTLITRRQLDQMPIPPVVLPHVALLSKYEAQAPKEKKEQLDQPQALQAMVWSIPINRKLMICRVESLSPLDGKTVSVLVHNNAVFARGLRVIIRPHELYKGFYRTDGPVPFFPGDRSFPMRLRKHKEKLGMPLT